MENTKDEGSRPTPGPWIARGIDSQTREFNGFRYAVSRNGAGWWIALITGGQNSGRGEALANARIIAAAPELLAACKAIRDGWEHNLTEPMALVNAAIARAEGKRGKGEAGCAFNGAVGEQITCERCLSDSPFHESDSRKEAE